MHVAFALMIAVPAILLVRNRVLKALWAVYPLVVTFVVVVTANHFWMDAVLGALVAAVSAYRRLRGVRPRPARGLGLAPAGKVTRDRRADPTAPAAAGRSRRAGSSARSREPPDRVAADPQRDLDDRLRPERGRGRADPRASTSCSRAIAFIVGLGDGHARRPLLADVGKGTPFGAFLDSTLDRIEEGVVLAAVAAYFAQAGRGGRRGRHGARRGGLLHGQLHARPRGGARRGVQGRDRLSGGPGSDPLSGPRVRGRRD